MTICWNNWSKKVTMVSLTRHNFFWVHKSNGSNYIVVILSASTIQDTCFFSVSIIIKIPISDTIKSFINRFTHSSAKCRPIQRQQRPKITQLPGFVIDSVKSAIQLMVICPAKWQLFVTVSSAFAQFTILSVNLRSRTALKPSAQSGKQTFGDWTF